MKFGKKSKPISEKDARDFAIKHFVKIDRILDGVLSNMIVSMDDLSTYRKERKFKPGDLLFETKNWCKAEFGLLPCLPLYRDAMVSGKIEQIKQNSADSYALEDTAYANTMQAIWNLINMKVFRNARAEFDVERQSIVVHCEVRFPDAVDLMISEEKREELASFFSQMVCTTWIMNNWMLFKAFIADGGIRQMKDRGLLPKDFDIAEITKH